MAKNALNPRLLPGNRHHRKSRKNWEMGGGRRDLDVKLINPSGTWGSYMGSWFVSQVVESSLLLITEQGHKMNSVRGAESESRGTGQSALFLIQSEFAWFKP